MATFQETISQFDHLLDTLSESIVTHTARNILSTIVHNSDYGRRISPMVDENLIANVQNIKIDSTFRIVTYKNIHFEDRYGINIKPTFDYVLKKINEDRRDMAKSFDSESVIQEAIAEGLRFATGKTPKKKLTLTEFKYYYQLKAFGSYKKVQVFPKTMQLIILAHKTPMMVEYMERKLMFTQIRALESVVNSKADEYAALAKKDPKHRRRYRAYVTCLSNTLRTMLSMYKIIRNTLLVLQREYFNVFREIKHININSKLYLECSDITNSYLKSLNESIENLKSSEEYGELDNDHEQISMGVEFIEWSKSKRAKFKERLDNLIKPRLVELSKLDTDNKYFGVPKFIAGMHEYSGQIRSLIDYFSDLENIDGDSLIQDIRVKLDIVDKCNDINSLRNAILTIYKDRSDSELDTEMLVGNILEGIELADYIDTTFYDKLMTISSKLDSPSQLEHFKNVYVAVTVIVDTIYSILLDSLVMSIGAIL